MTIHNTCTDQRWTDTKTVPTSKTKGQCGGNTPNTLILAKSSEKWTCAFMNLITQFRALQAFSHQQDQAATVLKVNIAKLNPMGNEMNCNQAINIEVTFSCTGNSQLCFYDTQSKSDWQYCSIASWLIDIRWKIMKGQVGASWLNFHLDEMFYNTSHQKIEPCITYNICDHNSQKALVKIIMFCPCSKWMAKYWNRWRRKFVTGEIERRCCGIVLKVEATKLSRKLFEDGYSFLSTKSRPESPSDRL